jgi:AcrR family transcriptional regulator
MPDRRPDVRVVADRGRRFREYCELLIATTGGAEMADAARPRRAYRSPLREEQAARTRHRIVEAAAELFSAQGYTGTTMGEIARAAEVSVESVHATGPKAGLLVEAIRQRYSGDGRWTSLLEAHRVQDVVAGADVDDGIDRIVDLIASAHTRSARLMLELRTVAALEPLVSERWEGFLTAKRESWIATAEWMVRAADHVPVESTPQVTAELAATINVLASAETYVQLTSDWELDEDRYRAWLGRHMRQARP